MTERDFLLAVVTGASHRLGKALALEAARRGFALALHFNTSAQAAEETAASLREMGTPVFLFQADLRDPAAIEEMFVKIADLKRPLRLLVNSASVMPRGKIPEVNVAEWDDCLAVNTRAPLLCAQYAAKLMAPDGGLIVNMTDAGVGRAWTGFPVYAVSKAALETLTKLLAKSLAPRVRVNAIAPGLILPSAGMDAADWERLVDRLPMKRSGTTDEVCRALGYLLENTYITGQTLVVDGGYQLV